MPLTDPATVRVRSLVERFFPEKRYGQVRRSGIPNGWKPWHPPTKGECLIDDQIRRRIDAPRTPSITHDQLAKAGIACPFLEARWLIINAVIKAAQRAAGQHAAREAGGLRDRLKFIETRSGELAEALKDLEERVALFDMVPNMPSSRYGTVPDEEAQYILDEVGKAGLQIRAAEEALRRWEVRAKAERERVVPDAKDGEIWRQQFVYFMGFAWERLTSEEPKNSDPFLAFLNAAMSDLGDGDVDLRGHRDRVLRLVKNWQPHDQFTFDVPRSDAFSDHWFMKRLNAGSVRLVDCRNLFAEFPMSEPKPVLVALFLHRTSVHNPQRIFLRPVGDSNQMTIGYSDGACPSDAIPGSPEMTPAVVRAIFPGIDLVADAMEFILIDPDRLRALLSACRSNHLIAGRLCGYALAALPPADQDELDPVLQEFLASSQSVEPPDAGWLVIPYRGMQYKL